MDSIKFYAIGDFGHQDPKLGVTMNQHAMDNGKPDFVLVLGDNFYPRGVSSVEDPQFKSIFQDGFIIHENLQVPWYISLGNHDYEGNIQAQIDYTFDEKNIGGYWKCPSNNYTIRHGPLELFALDTNGIQRGLRRKYPHLESELQENIHWLSQALDQSTAEIKIVFAHHPLYSKGKNHGKLGRVLAERYDLERVLVEHGVAAYFTGHEHVFQQTESNGVNHFVCGASVDSGFYGGMDPSLHVDWFDTLGSKGFVSVEISLVSPISTEPTLSPSQSPPLTSPILTNDSITRFQIIVQFFTCHCLGREGKGEGKDEELIIEKKGNENPSRKNFLQEISTSSLRTRNEKKTVDGNLRRVVKERGESTLAGGEIGLKERPEGKGTNKNNKSNIRSEMKWTPRLVKEIVFYWPMPTLKK